MSLEAVGRLVDAHSSISSSEIKANKAQAEKVILRRMFKGLGWGILIVLVGMIAMLVNSSLSPDTLIRWIAAAVMLMGTIVSGFAVFRGIREGIEISGPASRSDIAPAEETKSLPTGRIPVPLPSVTEHTTQLMADKEHPK